jgi:hypothetical protein
MMKTAETRIARSGIILGAVSALTLAISSGAMAAGTMTPYTDIAVGNAGSECLQLGAKLGVEFPYSYKWNEGSGEGAPNKSEIANFDDAEGNLDHSNTITIENSTGSVFDWSATNTIGAVMVKSAQGYNVYTYDPQAPSDVGLVGYQDKEVSHVTFCWIKDEVQALANEWCSPGYWRQVHHLDSWPEDYKPEDNFAQTTGMTPKLSKQGVSAAKTNVSLLDPTLSQVLAYPQYYGGDAFNAVGDLLSAAHVDVNYGGERVEDSCPLN